jgi:anti-sigma-K factor RskA
VSFHSLRVKAYEDRRPKIDSVCARRLEPSERAALEHLVSEDGEMRSEVEATRAFAAQLRKELQLEDSAPLTESQRARVLAAAETRGEPTVVTDNVTRISRWGGWFLRAAACLAALGVAVGVFFPPTQFVESSGAPIGTVDRR